MATAVSLLLQLTGCPASTLKANEMVASTTMNTPVVTALSTTYAMNRDTNPL
jgi:hypothetical protein